MCLRLWFPNSWKWPCISLASAGFLVPDCPLPALWASLLVWHPSTSYHTYNGAYELCRLSMSKLHTGKLDTHCTPLLQQEGTHHFPVRGSLLTSQERRLVAGNYSLIRQTLICLSLYSGSNLQVAPKIYVVRSRSLAGTLMSTSVRYSTQAAHRKKWLSSQATKAIF